MSFNGATVSVDRMVDAWTHQHRNPDTRSQITWGRFYDDNPTEITACLGGRAIITYAAANPDEVELVWSREIQYGPGRGRRVRNSLTGVRHTPDPDAARFHVRPHQFAQWLFGLDEATSNVMFSGSITDGQHRRLIRDLTKVDPDPGAPEETAQQQRRAASAAMLHALTSTLSSWDQQNLAQQYTAAGVVSSWFATPAPSTHTYSYTPGAVTAVTPGWYSLSGVTSGSFTFSVAPAFEQEFAALVAQTPPPVLAAA